MDFRTLEVVLWIHRLGGFRAAAERLNTTQPALSHRIHQLERELGVELFHRQRPRVTLTERGREFLRYAEQILELRARMVSAVGQRNALSGVLRLGVTETIVHTWLPEFVQRVSTDFPQLVLEMEVDDSPTLKERLAAFDLDLVFVAGAFDDAVGQGVLLSTCPVRFVRSPSLALPDRPTLEEIATCPIVTFSRRSHLHPMVSDLFGGLGLPRPRIHASSSMATIMRMAVDGIGIAIVPTAIVRKQLNSGELVEVETSPTFPDLPFWAVWLRGSESSMAREAGMLAGSIAAKTLYR